MAAAANAIQAPRHRAGCERRRAGRDAGAMASSSAARSSKSRRSSESMRSATCNGSGAGRLDRLQRRERPRTGRAAAAGLGTVGERGAARLPQLLGHLVRSGRSAASSAMRARRAPSARSGLGVAERHRPHPAISRASTHPSREGPPRRTRRRVARARPAANCRVVPGPRPARSHRRAARCGCGDRRRRARGPLPRLRRVAAAGFPGVGSLEDFVESAMATSTPVG